MPKIIVNLLHKELSYQIHGAAIEVRKDFGPGHKEKLYQSAFAEELKRREILFEKEKAIKIYSPKDGKYIGLYRPDFIVEQKVIVEIKAERFVNRDEIKRIYDYLRNSEYELAYFINFVSPRLFVRRIIYSNDRKPFNPLKAANIKLNNAKNLLASISLILALIGGLIGGLHRAEAAQLNLISQVQEVGVDQQLKVDLILNTESKEINAIEGNIVFPLDLLELKEIRDGNSIINFWVDKPQMDANINTNKGGIRFSGITPSGYLGERGLILLMVFTAKKEGRAIVQITGGKTLLNDGKGTAANLTTSSLSLAVISESISVPSRITALPDTEPPEIFKPEIAKDAELFNGKYFLVFATQDKGSGVAAYAIHESTRIKKLIDTKSWAEAESPYVLKDQELRSYIYVKAVDKAGNERIALLEPRYPMKWYENYENWIIIIIAIAIAVALFWRWKKSKKLKLRNG